MYGLKNRVQLIGHLGRDPEIRTTQTGRKVASVTIATTDTFTVNGERKEDTQWHNLTIWGKLADIVEKYWKKGSFLLVEGKLNHRSYDDKDGQKKYFTEVVVSNFMFLEKRGQSSDNSSENLQDPVHQVDEDDLPF